MGKRFMIGLIILVIFIGTLVGARYMHNKRNENIYVLNIYRHITKVDGYRVEKDFIADRWWDLISSSKNQDSAESLLEVAETLEWETIDSMPGSQSDEVIMLSKDGIVYIHWKAFIHSDENKVYLYASSRMIVLPFDQYISIINHPFY